MKENHKKKLHHKKCINIYWKIIDRSLDIREISHDDI